MEGGWRGGCRCARETTTDQVVEVEGSREVGGGMVGRAEELTAGGTVAEGLVAAGTVGPKGRVAAKAVETAEVSGARGCGVVGATKVARLAKAGCRAAGATRVARLGEAGGCCAAGATKVVRVAEAGGCWAAGTGGSYRECAHSPDVYEVWLRWATAMSAAVERFWTSREARRASCSRKVRLVSAIPARVVADVRSGLPSFFCRGRSSRSCSAVAKSRACWSTVVLTRWSTEVLAFSIPSSTSRRETNLILACIPGSRLFQKGARCPRWGGGPSVAVWKARGRKAAGRNPRVRPVPERDLPRMSVEGTGELSMGGREAEGDGEAVLLSVVEAEVVGEDMLREARKGARDKKSRGRYMGPAVKGGWLAASVVTRGVVQGYEIRIQEHAVGG